MHGPHHHRSPPPPRHVHPLTPQICTTHTTIVPLLTHHFLTPPRFLARTINPQEKKQLEDDPLDNATAGPDGTATLPPPPFASPRSKPNPRTGTRMKTSHPPLVHHSPPHARACVHPLYIRVVRVVRPLLTLSTSFPFRALVVVLSSSCSRRARSGSFHSVFVWTRAPSLLFIRVCQTTRTFCSGRR